MKVLVEGIGSMTFGPELKYYKILDWDLVGIDIDKYSFGLYTNNMKHILCQVFRKKLFSKNRRSATKRKSRFNFS